MKIKVDENLPASLSALFREFGHNPSTVIEEGLSGHPDPDVFEAARAEERCLVTLDRGFGDIRAYPPGTHAGIIVLRVSEQRPDVIRALLRTFLLSRELEELAGCNMVLEDGAVRIRRPGPSP